MYGKTFESMYEGSMYGAGPVCFALMGYVIAKTKKSRIELNPKKLADTFGCSQLEVEKAIEWATSPDGLSRNKEHEGRRLVKEGMFQYYVPSWEYYRGLRDEDERREYNRKWMAEKREKEKIEIESDKDAKELARSGEPDAWDKEIEIYKKGRKFQKGKPAAQVMAELEEGGKPTDTHSLAAKLREIHGLKEGEDGSEDGLTPEERIAVVKAKIARLEAIEQKVAQSGSKEAI